MHSRSTYLPINLEKKEVRRDDLNKANNGRKIFLKFIVRFFPKFVETKIRTIHQYTNEQRLLECPYASLLDFLQLCNVNISKVMFCKDSNK
jgi:hypothetical protein